MKIKMKDVIVLGLLGVFLFIFVTGVKAVPMKIKKISQYEVTQGNKLIIWCIGGYQYVEKSTLTGTAIVQSYENNGNVTPLRCKN